MAAAAGRAGPGGRGRGRRGRVAGPGRGAVRHDRPGAPGVARRRRARRDRPRRRRSSGCPRARPAGGGDAVEPARGRSRRAGLRAVHLRLHRGPQGRAGAARRGDEPAGLGERHVRRRPRRPGAAGHPAGVRPVRLQRVRSAARRRRGPDARRGGRGRPREAARPPAHRAGHRVELRPGGAGAAGTPPDRGRAGAAAGPAQRRLDPGRAAHRGPRGVPRHRGRRAGRPHRDHGVEQLLPVRRGRPGVDVDPLRAPHPQREPVRARLRAAPGGPGRAGGPVRRGRLPRPRLPRGAGAHRGRVPPGPVRRTRIPDVPDRRPGPAVAGRDDGVPGQARPPGQGARPPGGARGGRLGAGVVAAGRARRGARPPRRGHVDALPGTPRSSSGTSCPRPTP